MYKIYRMMWLWIVVVGMGIASQSFIVLSYGEEEMMKEQEKSYVDFAFKEVIPSANTQIVKMADSYMLRVGPYVHHDALALSYMKIKTRFPHAVIVEKKETTFVPKPIVQTIEKKVYVNKEVPTQEVDDTFWIALFGLAIVGILFMFLSSDQMKRLKEEHERMKTKHKKLEQKQHEVLSSMGENIHTLAKETMGHTSSLAQKIKETPLYKEMEKVMYNENELLDITEDLIKFLRLKSKKVVIQHEVFNFNHVLNDVAGTLSQAHKKSDTELVFDIEKDVPRYMLADSLHMGQILSNVLEYMIQETQNNEIKVGVKIQTSLKEGLQLHFHLGTKLDIEDEETLFDSYYDENSRRYVGLGLFVAKELTQLMNGTLKVVKGSDRYQHFEIMLPIEEKNREKRQYRLPDKGLINKKILIVDSSDISAHATEKLFAYFRAEVKVLTHKAFKENLPNLAMYDIVALHHHVFTFKILEALKKVKSTQNLKVICLDNLFSSEVHVKHDVIDISLVKPLTQEYVFDTLIELYATKQVAKGHIKVEALSAEDKISLPIHRERFKDIPNINLESFRVFKGAHVLIVEDNIINQKVVMNVLGKSEMTLNVANNGEEAVTFMHQNVGKVDFIFMDINMPVMDGYSASERIRKDSRFDEVAIVALTALVSEHEIEKMFDAGMNGYLAKPVRIDRLYDALDVFLSGLKDKTVVLPSPTKRMDEVLEGLDVKDGLSHMKNNNIFYKEVLKEFIDAYAQSDSLFEKLVKEKRYTQVKMLCLDMKGLTGTIGAKEMHNVINEIHQYIIYKKPELLDAYVSRYNIEFRKLRTSIERYLAS